MLLNHIDLSNYHFFLLVRWKLHSIDDYRISNLDLYRTSPIDHYTMSTGLTGNSEKEGWKEVSTALYMNP